MPEEIVVSMQFSHAPDTASVERNFSLTADGNRVKGNFFWDGRKLTFSPLMPIEKNTDYILSLSADAHDKKGLSMDEAFNREFTTRADNTRPILIFCYPQMHATVSDPREEIRLTFSIPVPLKTLYDNVTFNPSMAGSWRLEEDGIVAVFSPSEPWVQLKEYEIRISASLTANNGINIGNEFISLFTIGDDHEKPYLLNAKRITKDDSFYELVPDIGYSGAAQLPVENDGWEKYDRLFLIFSKPVDSISLKNNLTAEDASSLVLEGSHGYSTEFIFRFENSPVYESRFTFKIKSGIKDSAGNETKDEYIYRIFVDGKFSKPPELAGIRMLMSPNNVSNKKLFTAGTDSLFINIPINDENYPSGETLQTWIEIYFDTAEGALIDIFSLMEHFRIETSNNVITFSPRRIKENNFSVQQPHSDWENFSRMEIIGDIKNTTNYGLINFIIGAGLKDSLGNINDKTLKISVIK
jgi:hypothetical protein